MRTIDEADAHQRSFGVENIRINAVERVASVIVLPVAGRTGEQVVRYAVFGKRRKYFFGISVANLINPRKIWHDFALGLPAERADLI